MGQFRIQICLKLVMMALIAFAASKCVAQPRVQLPPSGYQPNPWITNPPAQGLFPSGGMSPQPSSPVFGNFDPYAPGFRPSTAPMPTMNTPNWGLGNLFNWSQPAPLPLGTGPTYPIPVYNQPIYNQPIQNPYPYNPPTMGQPQFPSTIYPNSNPNVLFPSTNGSPPLNSTWNFQNQTNPFGFQQNNFNWNNWWNSAGSNLNYGTNQVVRLFQGPRVRHTWLPGTDGFNGKKNNAIETNDTDVSLVFAIPNFLNSTRPLYIIPSYSQHEWEGPSVVGSDLPGSAFSAFLDTGWESNPVQTLGIELGARVGVFSAFDAVNSESIRIQGKALGRLRLTPTSTLRAGVFYIDRNKIKLIPAGGILWIPNQDTRFDLFFPEPKLAHYLSTVGNADIWWYLTGYYGGGAWTIKQTDGTNDEIDINDIRLMMGLEFGKSDQIRQGFRLGFVEAGYAFNRELIYKVRSSSNLDLENSFVLRAGFAY